MQGSAMTPSRINTASQGLNQFRAKEIYDQGDRSGGRRRKPGRSTAVDLRLQPHAPQRVDVIVTPAATTSWIERLVAAIRHGIRHGFGNLIPASQPAPVLAPAPWMQEPPVEAAPSPRGATPLHYRAFSLLQPRLTGDVYSKGDPIVVIFRNRVKTIKEQKDQVVHDTALAVLDTFILLVDSFIPLWDGVEEAETLMLGQTGTGARLQLRHDMLSTITTMDRRLAEILTPIAVSRDRFDTVQRFVDVRYGEQPKAFDLEPI